MCGNLLLGGQDTTTKRTTTSTTPRTTAPPTTTQAGGGEDCGDIFHIEVYFSSSFLYTFFPFKTEELGAWNGVVAITTTSHVVVSI